MEGTLIEVRIAARTAEARRQEPPIFRRVGGRVWGTEDPTSKTSPSRPTPGCRQTRALLFLLTSIIGAVMWSDCCAFHDTSATGRREDASAQTIDELEAEEAMTAPKPVLAS